jgi:hypothetical protein
MAFAAAFTNIHLMGVNSAGTFQPGHISGPAHFRPGTFQA